MIATTNMTDFFKRALLKGKMKKLSIIKLPFCTNYFLGRIRIKVIDVIPYNKSAVLKLSLVNKKGKSLCTIFELAVHEGETITWDDVKIIWGFDTNEG